MTDFGLGVCGQDKGELTVRAEQAGSMDDELFIREGVRVPGGLSAEVRVFEAVLEVGRIGYD